MRRFRLVLLRASIWLAPLFFSHAQTSTDDAAVLHLEDALALADAANRQEASTRIGVAKAEATVGETKTSYFPQLKFDALTGIAIEPLSLTIPAGSLGTYTGIGPLPKMDSNISSPQQFSGLLFGTAQQPLTQLYKVHLAVGEAQLGVPLAKEQLRQARQQLADQVRQSYYAISQAQGQLHAIETQVAYLKELSLEAQNNLNQQTILQSDALTVTANLKNAQYQQVAAEDSLALKKENFNYLLARPIQTPFSVDDVPQPRLQELDLEQATKQALAQRPELRLARLQEQQAEFEVRREHADYIPDISVGITSLSFLNVSFFPANVTNLGFMLQWQPWDWGQKKQKLASLKGSSEQATLKTADIEQQIRLDVDQAFRALRRSRMQVDAQASALDAEKERFRETQNQYHEKAILLSDLMKEESAVAQAISNYANALSGFWTAKADFAKALGED
jgi:outer membrane protein